MSEHDNVRTSDEPEPTTATGPTTVRRYTLRGKKWVFGATLAAAGLVAGSGATYAITTATAPSQSQAFADRGARGAGGPGGAGLGSPPDGTVPGATTQDGTAPDGNVPSGAPSTGTGTTGG